MLLVVGGRGLTGSALVRELRQRGIEHDNVQRENRRQFHGRSCDVLVFCAGNSMKWKAAEDPNFDFTASVAHLSYYMHEIRAAKFVLLSDVEVYGECTSVEDTREELPRSQDARSTYAYHKLLSEEVTRRFAARHLVLRLPTLVGPGLRRNLVHDLVHGERPLRTARGTKINVLHTDHLARQLLRLLDEEAEGTFNLAATDSIDLDEVGRICGSTPDYRPDPGAPARDQAIAIDKVRPLVQLESSAEALRRYQAARASCAESA